MFEIKQFEFVYVFQIDLYEQGDTRSLSPFYSNYFLRTTITLQVFVIQKIFAVHRIIFFRCGDLSSGHPGS